jgi:hypothetical protein
MAVVALTESERNTLMFNAEWKQICQQRVLTKAAYFMTLTSALTIQDMKNRLHAATLEYNPNILINDEFLGSTFLFNMLTRDFANKDDEAVGLVAQVEAYLDATNPKRFDYIVDDYFVDRTVTMLH